MSYPMMMMPQARSRINIKFLMVPIFIIFIYFIYRRFLQPWWAQYSLWRFSTWIPDFTKLNSPWWNQFKTLNPSTWFKV